MGTVSADRNQIEIVCGKRKRLTGAFSFDSAETGTENSCR